MNDSYLRYPRYSADRTRVGECAFYPAHRRDTANLNVAVVQRQKGGGSDIAVDHAAVGHVLENNGTSTLGAGQVDGAKRFDAA